MNEKSKQLLNSWSQLRVLVVGDVMVDSYLFGKVERISPEAPVPVLEVKKSENRLGGSANVALNLKALGLTPLLLACVGDDAAGQTFHTLMHQHQLPTVGLFTLSGRPTTRKTRLMSGAHQLLRVDEESTVPLIDAHRNRLINVFNNLWDKQAFDAIIFEDYDKGLLDQWSIGYIIQKANDAGIPVAVDPKQRNFLHYKHVQLFKPNIKEMRDGLKMECNPENYHQLLAAEQHLRALLHHDITLLTLSEHGIMAGNAHTTELVPAHPRKIADVSGAGDTVISVATACLALKWPMREMAALANLAGGLVCEHPGVVPIDANQLLLEWEKLNQS